MLHKNKACIRQPCNYVSNIAYYQGVVELCSKSNWSMPMKSGVPLLVIDWDTIFMIGLYNYSIIVNLIKKAYASWGAGSADFHGSATHIGKREDSSVNNLLAYAIFHEMIKPLASNDSVINELSNQTRYVKKKYIS